VGRNATRRAGFSLTELLVVSTVISVLAGLSLPALGRAREKARQSVCVGNLRQLGQAALLYQDDHGRLPTSAFAGYLLWNGTDYLLYGRLVPSCGRALAKSFYCPSAAVFPMNSPATGLANLGVPGRTTAGNYYARSFAQGAPALADTRTQALLADLPDQHPTGLHVLYSDGGARFVSVPANWNIAASNAWAALDAGAVLP